MDTIDVIYENWSYHKTLDSMAVHSLKSEYTYTHKVWGYPTTGVEVFFTYH